MFCVSLTIIWNVDWINAGKNIRYYCTQEIIFRYENVKNLKFVKFCRSKSILPNDEKFTWYEHATVYALSMEIVDIRALVDDIVKHRQTDKIQCACLNAFHWTHTTRKWSVATLPISFSFSVSLSYFVQTTCRMLTTTSRGFTLPFSSFFLTY